MRIPIEFAPQDVPDDGFILPGKDIIIHVNGEQFQERILVLLVSKNYFIYS